MKRIDYWVDLGKSNAEIAIDKYKWISKIKVKGLRPCCEYRWNLGIANYAIKQQGNFELDISAIIMSRVIELKQQMYSVEWNAKLAIFDCNELNLCNEDITDPQWKYLNCSTAKLFNLWHKCSRCDKTNVIAKISIYYIENP